jgi:hypothetical protein
MARRQHNRIVTTHMRVCMWLQTLPKVPAAITIAIKFNTSENTARQWRTAFLDACRPPLVPATDQE